MGISLFEFYELEPRQFQNYATGYLDAKEVKEKEGWYQTRWISFWSAIGYLKKNTTPEKLMEFPWDKEQVQGGGMPTPEEIEAVREYWKNLDEKRNGAADS